MRPIREFRFWGRRQQVNQERHRREEGHCLGGGRGPEGPVDREAYSGRRRCVEPEGRAAPSMGVAASLPAISTPIPTATVSTTVMTALARWAPIALLTAQGPPAGGGASSVSSLPEVSSEAHPATSGRRPPRVQALVAGPLTEREREIAAMVAWGLTAREIVAALVISVRAGEGHVDYIRNKLGMRSRAQIAASVVARGLFSDPPPPGT